MPGKRKNSEVPEVDDKTDFSKLRWCVGIRFPNRDVFRDCVTRYAIAQGRNLTFDKSDKARGQRLGVRCVPGCPFKLYCSWDNQGACMLVKSVDPHHTCHRNMERNRQLKKTWLTKQLLEVFKSRPHWPASEIIDTVRKAYKIIIKKNFAYKVKYFAHRMLHGSMKEHYKEDGFFVCFHALGQGWLEGCRRVLSVDSCFLKTFLGGQLIAATGRDANEQMYPLAWAVVEGENNDNYEWFFKELKKVLGEEDGDGWTIISYQHQSIVTMVAQELPKNLNTDIMPGISLPTGTSLTRGMK
ncbi:uncharacterized protein LOC141651371 [Silene latifolia]|uniref:uncharacterized protein LOC141651371 n=1 Tax=Silene latifolia TaxID=37657 RepID=UPI003D76DFDC